MSDDPRIEAMMAVQLGSPEGVYFEDVDAETLSLARDAAEALLAAADAVDPLRAPVVPPTEPTARGALAELVRLHDGPRDAAYERDKPTAWATARALVAPTEPDERKG